MCSPGCARCYAETMSRRISGMARADIKAGRNPGRKAHYLNVLKPDGKWNGKVERVPEALTDPFSWKRPRRVFVNSMSDLFHETVPFDYVDKVFAVMALCPQHTFQILTKRPERMAEYFGRDNGAHGGEAYESVLREVDRLRQQGIGWTNGAMIGVGWPLRNVWLGTSVEDQQRAEERIPHLLDCPASVRFLSCEPLLGEIDLRSIGSASTDTLTGWTPARDEWPEGSNGARIDLVIVGCESGTKRRPSDVAWHRSLRAQCASAGVAFFEKQIEVDGEVSGDIEQFPADLRVREFPEVAR